jgi:hypothetical protein
MKNPDKLDFTRQHDLTIDEVQACPTFQHVSDQEAEEIIKTFKLFTKIVYDFYKKEGETR